MTERDTSTNRTKKDKENSLFECSLCFGTLGRVDHVLARFACGHKVHAECHRSVPVEPIDRLNSQAYLGACYSCIDCRAKMSPSHLAITPRGERYDEALLNRIYKIEDHSTKLTV